MEVIIFDFNLEHFIFGFKKNIFKKKYNKD